MSRRRTRAGGSFHRRRIAVLAVAGQLPVALALILAGGVWPLLLLPAAALTACFFDAYRTPWSLEPRSGLLPFFAWWVGCAHFALLAPVALLLDGRLPHVWPATAVACAA